MSKEGEEDEAFEIQDFTIATPWENFIAEVENTLRMWIIRQCPDEGEGVKEQECIIKKEIIPFDDHLGSFSIGYYKWNTNTTVENTLHQEYREWEKKGKEKIVPEHLTSSTLLFAHPQLYKFYHWFNCKEFILIQPTVTPGNEVTIKLDQSHLLLSSLSIVLNNMNRFDLPVFVPVRESWHDEYLGICQHNYIYPSTGLFEESSIHFHSEAQFSSPYSLPTRYTLVKQFFERLEIAKTKKQAFSVFSRFSYIRRPGDMEDHGLFDLETEESLTGYASEDEMEYVQEVNRLFYGPSQDLINTLRLICSWGQGGTNQEMDEICHSPLRPLDADSWNIRASIGKDAYFHLTGDISSFLSLVKNVDSFPAKSPLPAVQKRIDAVLASLFAYKKGTLSVKPSSIALPTDGYGAPSGTILSALAVDMIQLQNASEICALWIYFIKEVRWHWEQESSLPIPLVPLLASLKGGNSNACAIYRNLQIVHFCGQHKNQKEFEREGEKALHYLETISTSEVLLQMTGIAILEALNVLCCSGAMKVKFVMDTMTRASTSILKLFTLSAIGNKEADSLIETLRHVEWVVSAAECLLIKFVGQFDLVQQLMVNGQHSVCKEARQIVGQFFITKEGFPPPEEEEFVIETRTILPSYPATSSPALQRLFANISGNEYRIATAIAYVE